ncbi:MAG: OPT family oligopeptide transporter [Myxococcota bacterium]
MSAAESTPSTPAAVPPAERPENPELKWLREVYQRGAKQLTPRAVVMGMLLGAIMCLSNLYVVLKTGWSLGVTITACILAFAIFRMLSALRLVRTEFSLLENNAMGSVASAAGYMTGGGNMAAIPALLVLTGALPPTWQLIMWCAVIAVMGVFAAIPIKRQLINIEQLPFPTGTATAETLRSLHSHGEAADKARMLGYASVVGALVAWFRDAKASWMPFNLPHGFPFPGTLRGKPAEAWTLSMEASLILISAGALMSWRTGWSLLLGGVLTYLWLGPMFLDAGVIPSVSYKIIVQATLWPGAALLVSSGLMSFAYEWRSIARSVVELVRLFKPARTDESDPLAEIECPQWWFPVSFAVLSPIIVALMWFMFGIPWWAGLVAIPLSVLMGMVAARVTGETDVTPTKALGPLTQFVYGGLLPNNLTANIMSANVTGGVGLHSADLLTDLKSGYLVGANPRQQLYAQLFGCVAGALVVIPVFNVLVPNAEALGGEKFPAPSVQVWASVSKILVSGVDALHPMARTAGMIGLLLGVVLVLLEKHGPKALRKFVPAPSGLGIAAVMPFYNALAMFLGALIAEIVRRKNPQNVERVVVPVSSGIIAGESLMGILVALLIVAGVLNK